MQGLTYCDYSRYYTAAIRRDGKGMIDTRGTDPNNCKLFREGEPDKERNSIVILGKEFK